MTTAITAAASLALAALVQVQESPPTGRLWGSVVTEEGERLEGWVRWDRNEAAQGDVLDARREVPWDLVHELERLDEGFCRWREMERSLEVAGVRLVWEEDDPDDPLTTPLAIRFAHVRGIERLEHGRARLTLRSGEEIAVGEAASDFGVGFRGLVVERPSGELERLRWSELERIDLAAPPERASPPGATRLHGTARTRAGLEVTGFLAWNRDAALTSDSLAGRVTGQVGRRRRLAFAEVERIERRDARSAVLALRSGERLVLLDANGVGRSGGGVEVSDPALGRVVVPWQELEEVRFAWGSAPYAGAPGDAPARSLAGEVVTRDGERWAGRLRWGWAERSWEMLRGRAGNVELDVELARVRRIEAGAGAADADDADARGAGASGRAARRPWRVTLADGRALVLEVDEEPGGAPGVLVRPDVGDAVLVRWEDVARVELELP